MTPDDHRTRRGRRLLLLLMVLFLIPPAIAWTLYFSGWRPATTSNHGELLDPPVRLDVPELSLVAGPDAAAPDLRGEWTLLMTLNGTCGETCMERLRQTRQIRLALAEDARRLQRVLVVPEEGTAPTDRQLLAQEDLHVVTSRSLEWTRTPRDDEALSMSLVDTRGFQMMRYAQPVNPSGMLEDLRHLLRLSNSELETLDGLSDRD